MSKWVLGTTAYVALFLPYIFIPPPLDRIFISAYVAVLIVSLLLPLRRRGVASSVSAGFFRGMLAFLFVVIIVSLYMILASILLNQDASKYAAVLWIFFSLIPAFGSAFRLSRLGGLLKESGMTNQNMGSVNQSRLDHFALDYSLQRWLRHPDFFLYFLAILAMYLYGWSLLGLPLLLYSVSLLILTSLVLRTLAKQLLAPYGPHAVIQQMESISGPKEIRASLARPSPKTTLLIAAVLTLAIFTNLVENPFSGSNFAIFFLLVLTYAAALIIYIWASGPSERSQARP